MTDLKRGAGLDPVVEIAVPSVRLGLLQRGEGWGRVPLVETV